MFDGARDSYESHPHPHPLPQSYLRPNVAPNNSIGRLPERLGAWVRTLSPSTAAADTAVAASVGGVGMGMGTHASSGKVVALAIAGNLSVVVSKFAAFVVSGSGTMLSEAVHSIADLANQCLLAIGMSEVS